jgi:hypothetical protein
MSNNHEQFRVAVLDDYQNVALAMADWSALKERAAVTVFNDHVADVDAVVSRLQPFDIVCVMRERTPITRSEPAGDSAHRLCFAWPLPAVLSGHRRQHIPMAR